MSSYRTTGISLLIILIAALLIGITTADILTGETTDITEQDIVKMTEEVINEISTYIQIKDQKGKYFEENNVFRIKKIAIWISPLVSQNIDLSKLTIQLDDGEKVIFLTYNGLAQNMQSSSLFDQPIWDDLTGYNFGFLPICDIDNSIVDYDMMNENSDNAYILFKIPQEISMENGDELTVTLFPSTGITRITDLKAPLPTRSIVTFE
jgi:archaellin